MLQKKLHWNQESKYYTFSRSKHIELCKLFFQQTVQPGLRETTNTSQQIFSSITTRVLKFLILEVHNFCSM